MSKFRRISAAPTSVTDVLRMPDTFPGLFHVTDMRGRITQVSDDWLAALGYARPEVIGRKNVDFLTNDCAATSHARMAAFFEKGRMDDLSYEFVAKSGAVVPLRLSAQVITDSEGHPLGAVAVLRCIDAKDDAVEQLRLKSYRLQSCLEGTNAGTWEWNVQTGETRFNERWAGIVGYTLQELRPISIDTWLSLAHPDDLKRSATALQQHWDGKTEYYDIEVRMHHRDGHWVWVHDRGRVFTWTEDGKPEWMFGTHFSLDEQRKRARNAERMERLMNRTGHAAGIGGWELDFETNELLWTDETRRIHGVDHRYVPSVEEAIAFYAPEARGQLTRAVERAMTDGTPWDLELPIIRMSGERIWVRAIGDVEFRDGKPRSLYGALHDITDRVHQREELSRAREKAQEAQERLWSAVEAVPDAFALYDADDRVVMFNQKYRNLYAASGSVIQIGQTFEDILREGLDNGQYLDAKGRETSWLEERLEHHRNPSGPIAQELPGDQHVMVHEARLPNGDTVGFRVDVTQLKHQQRELERRASALESAAITDPLTGLRNRRGLDEYIRAVGDSVEHTFGLIHLDLDRFKPINDVFGHAAGDYLLRQMAKILTSSVRQDDCVARVGGDEFVLVLKGPYTEAMAKDVAERIISRCREPIAWQEKTLYFGASAGIAIGKAAKLSDLQKDADIALYEAKKAGRNRYHVFDDPLRRRVEDRKTLSDDLLVGLERGEIVAHYQPQICAVSGAVIGVEALARWEHPTRGLLSPETFLDIAEDLDLISCIDQSVYLHGIETGERLAGIGTGLPQLSINVSLKRLTETDDLAWLDRVETLPFRLNLEILESLDIDQDFDRITKVLEKIREKDVSIEIDDFGSGRASLTSLLKLTPKRIKLDGEITRAAVQKSTGASAMVRAIGEMCRGLGIAMTAEGLETKEQADLMKAMGCDVLQGFYFAPPLSRNDLETWLQAI